MIAPLVPAVIPRSSVSAAVDVVPDGLRLSPLPLPVLGPDGIGRAETVYALTAVDKSGRVADRGVLAKLGWSPGTPLDGWERAGVITVRVGDAGGCRVDGRGYLILALPVRRWCRLAAGDRLLLVADRGTGVLTGYPLPVLDRLLGAAAGTADGDGRG